MTNETPTTEQLLARIAELEYKLARVTEHRDMLHAWAVRTEASDADLLVTKEEIDEAMNGPRGRPILEVVSELEHRYGVE